MMHGGESPHPPSYFPAADGQKQRGPFAGGLAGFSTGVGAASLPPNPRRQCATSDGEKPVL